MKHSAPFYLVLAVAGWILAPLPSPATESFDPLLANTEQEDARASAWLNETSSKVSDYQAQLIRRAQAVLLGNIVAGDGWKPYRGIMPSPSSKRGVYNWDSAFHAVALSHWNPALAREQFSILFDKQQPNGLLPDVIWENGTMVTDFTKPPVIAWAVAVVDYRSPDVENLRLLYPKLRKLGDFWLNERGGKSDGLFFYAGTHAGNESGWDNSIRWDGGYQQSDSNDKRLWAVDLNCYMISHYRAMAYIAARLDLKQDQAQWLTEADALAKRVNERLWDDSIHSYADRDRKTGAFSPVLSPACFMPLFIHIAPPGRAVMMAKLAVDPRKFYPGFPSAAYDTHGFSTTTRWRGPTWLNTAYFALKGLRDYGWEDAAEQMRGTLLTWVAKDTSSIREYYDPKAGQGLGAGAFGWSAAFTLSLILDWDNSNLTFCFPPASKPTAASGVTVHLPAPPLELELPAATAIIHGNGARLDRDMIQHWDDLSTYVSWRVALPVGESEVVVQQASESVSAGNSYRVDIAGNSLLGTVKDTGAWTAVQAVSLGKIKMEKAREVDVILRPLTKKARGVMNLQGMILRSPRVAKNRPSPNMEPRSGTYFHKKHHTFEALPIFEQVSDQLPEPILPSHPDYQRMYWKSWQLAYSHLKQPQPGSPLVSNWIDEAFSPSIFQWDTCFMMMFARYGHYQFPAIQSLDNFYALQRPSGYICREYRESDGREMHFGFNGGYDDATGWKNSINPPIFAWAETETFKVTGDKSRFAAVLPALEKYVAWLNRDGDPADLDMDKSGRRSHGTPHQLYWNTGLGCGMDNTPKPTDKGCGWVDMSCQMVMQYNELALIYRELGQPEKAMIAEAEAKAIAERINRWCWDERDGFYYDVNAKGEKFRKKTACGFWPLIAGIASKEQAARLVAHLRNPKEFNRPFLFPSLAADEKEYNPDGAYWQGAVWAPTNYVIIKGLERYGYHSFAAESSEKYLAAMAEVFKKTGTVWENYAPESMSPGKPAKGDFVGWTACGPIALYIENVLGFCPDGVRNTLRWNLRLAEPHGIKHLRFGHVDTDILFDGNATVAVKASVPYTLIINRKTHAIPAGDSQITVQP